MSVMTEDVESAGLRLSQIAASLGGTRGQEVAQVRDVLKEHRCASVVEVVSGDEATVLPFGSVVIREEDGRPEPGAAAITLTDSGSRRGLRSDGPFVVLHRAPVEEPEVGKQVRSAAEMDALPVGTVLCDDAGTVGLRVPGGWAWTDGVQNDIGPYGGARIVYLPEGGAA